MSRRNSEYKRSSTHQAGLTERLLGHDAKERITSTLKALGIYKGDGGQCTLLVLVYTWPNDRHIGLACVA